MSGHARRQILREPLLPVSHLGLLLSTTTYATLGNGAENESNQLHIFDAPSHKFKKKHPAATMMIFLSIAAFMLVLVPTNAQVSQPRTSRMTYL
jgi:hypothetical protein